MRWALLAVILVPLAGCINSPLAYRGVVYHTSQEATTDGRIDNRPASGNATSNADKQLTDAVKLPLGEGR